MSIAVHIDEDAVPTKAKAARTTRKRPPLFRALGVAEPPDEVQIEGETLRRADIYKHDSWAATATYVSARRKVVCKFNRQQPIAFIPMSWLGRYLARKESRLLQRFAALGTVPRCCGPVSAGGEVLPNAVAHDFVPGHPLQEVEPVSDEFFYDLKRTLEAVHEVNVAYVDLHKREIVVVGEDGRPYLIDFQICYELPRRWPLNNFFTRWLLRLLQQSDVYHWQKHFARVRPDQFGMSIHEVRTQPPWFIGLHRYIGVPLRALRRQLLVLIGVRKGKGYVQTEQFIEDGLRGVSGERGA
jgi:hypothetical protein